MQFRSIEKILFHTIGGILFLGCIGSNEDYRNHTVRTPHRYIYRNMSRIVKYENKYETVLGTFGDSISRFTKLKYPSLKDINIEIYEVSNKTSDGKLPLSAQGMLIESISMLTATSGRFFIPKKVMVDTGAITQADDYAKYSKYVPRMLQIEGSIDRSDIIYSKSNSFQGDLTMTHRGGRTDLGFETEDKDNIREIALSLRFVNKMDGRNFGTYERYASTTNSIRIAKKTDGSGYGVFLLGSGIGGNGFKTFTPGVHQAIKILIQHSVIQIFGRYFEVPYWHCLDIYEVDKVQKNNMRLDWNKKSHEKKIEAVQLVLNMYGFSIPMKNKEEKEKQLALKKTELALNAIQKYLGISGNIQNFDYYFSLYNNMPFAGFFPKNYNNLRAEIVNINSANLPSYKEPERVLPKPPKPTYREPSSVIMRSDGGMDMIYDKYKEREKRIETYQKRDRRPESTPKPSFYDKDKQSIDDAEANLFK